MNYDIEFITRDKFYNLCNDILDTIRNAPDFRTIDIYRNIVDPFSAIFESLCNDISLREWIEREKTRQVQKTLQNAVGLFHQKILGSIYPWENLGTGNVVDLVNNESKIIAEIKNKFNTTKGNHKIAIYDDLDTLIKNKYIGYTAYYVAILTKKRIDRPFTPSDNRTKTHRQINENIREIDGASFYKLVTGDNDGLYRIYRNLPLVLSEILNNDSSKIIEDPLFEEFFKQAFK